MCPFLFWRSQAAEADQAKSRDSLPVPNPSASHAKMSPWLPPLTASFLIFSIARRVGSITRQFCLLATTSPSRWTKLWKNAKNGRSKSKILPRARRKLSNCSHPRRPWLGVSALLLPMRGSPRIWTSYSMRWTRDKKWRRMSKSLEVRLMKKSGGPSPRFARSYRQEEKNPS